MKTQNNKLTLSIAILAIAFFSSCGAKKSADQTDNSSIVASTPLDSLATCNVSNSASMSFNQANVIDASSGQLNADWIKIKFSFLSADVTQAGYSVKFFKWRVIGNTAQLDSVPLDFSSYTLSNGKTSSEPMTAVFATQIGQQSGFYIHLNDDVQNPYQVLKVVVYKSDGSIAAESDSLIPQFLASPIAYKTNVDGSPRAENLQKLHPLYSTDVTSWTQVQLKQNFDKYCF